MSHEPDLRAHAGAVVCLILIALGGFLMVYQLQRSIDAQTRVGDELNESQAIRCAELERQGVLDDRVDRVCAEAFESVAERGDQ